MISFQEEIAFAIFTGMGPENARYQVSFITGMSSRSKREKSPSTSGNTEGSTTRYAIENSESFFIVWKMLIIGMHGIIAREEASLSPCKKG
jgi:hypothetical protein